MIWKRQHPKIDAFSRKTKPERHNSGACLWPRDSTEGPPFDPTRSKWIGGSTKQGTMGPLAVIVRDLFVYCSTIDKSIKDRSGLSARASIVPCGVLHLVALVTNSRMPRPSASGNDNMAKIVHRVVVLVSIEPGQEPWFSCRPRSARRIRLKRSCPWFMIACLF